MFSCDPVHVGLPAAPAALAVAFRVGHGEVHLTIGPSPTVGSLSALEEALETFVQAVIDRCAQGLPFEVVVTFEVVPWGPGIDITPFVERLAGARWIRVRQVRA